MLTWCFTEIEKLDSVKPYIKDFSKQLGEFVPVHVTNNCCIDPAPLKKAFGDHEEVCQDSFHLIQRMGHAVNKTLPNS